MKENIENWRKGKPASEYIDCKDRAKLGLGLQLYLARRLFLPKRFETTPGRRRRRVKAIPRAAAAYGRQLKNAM